MAADRTLKSRRNFLSAALIGLSRKADARVEGTFVNESFLLGHRLRDRSYKPSPKRELRVPIVIVGGGVAGLSAAWRLEKQGFRDFVVLEMEHQVGGNSRWGENEITRFPWAAHYVPVPSTRAEFVRELMQDLGVFGGGKWDERHLCFSPQERLFIHGRWQEGVVPELASTRKDREAYARFEQLTRELRHSGEFTIPMELGAKPSPLDHLSMREWMRNQRLESEYLDWYVDYACRDDYGASFADTSAWAGLHYFAARDEAEDKGPLTWPEGNGWIIRQLLTRLSPFVRTNAPVFAVQKQGTKLHVLAGDTRYISDFVIFAAPTFLAPHIVEGAQPVRFQYSPWITANLVLKCLPDEKDLGLAWDNVIYDSSSLGYVVATHMSLRTHTEGSVWTWYMPLASGNPGENRRILLNRGWDHWKDVILNDLSRAHPRIRECIARIDIMRMGHAMVRPVPGSIFSEDRQRVSRLRGRLLYANSDLSGYSTFEEAQYRGVKAADHALRRLAMKSRM